jgi:hypothetical protein
MTPVAYHPSIWSGYIDYGEKYSAVSAHWTAPNFSCNSSANRQAIQWVGIDGGNGDGTVEQIGTVLYCPNNKPSLYGWYEMWPTDPRALPSSGYPISPGDSISASVSVVGVEWTLKISDITQSWNFSTNIASPHPVPAQTTAEWIVERSVGVPNFRHVTFSQATVIANGHRGPITEPSTVATEIASGSIVAVKPGPLSASGTSFVDIWRSDWP